MSPRARGETVRGRIGRRDGDGGRPRVGVPADRARANGPGRKRVRHQRRRSAVHLQADPGRAGSCGRWDAPRGRSEPGQLSGRTRRQSAAADGPADGRRVDEQPRADPRSASVRGVGSGLPASDDSSLPHRGGRDVLPANVWKRDRLAAAHHQQPGRRSVGEQPCGARGGHEPVRLRGVCLPGNGGARSGFWRAVHPEHHA